MILPIQKSNFINKPNIIPTANNNTVAQEPTSCTDKSLLPAAYYLPVNFSAKRTENCSTPVETTQNYIPKTKSADHLNLPDIHVFEYPDTNLRVLINIDSRENLNSTPKIQALAQQATYNNYNLLQEKLLQIILEKKLINIDNSITYTGAPFGFIYHYPETKEPDTKAADINNTIFNLVINNEEFADAKDKLIKVIKDGSLNNEDSNNFKVLFDNNYLKSKSSMINELSNLSINEFEQFYNSYKKNLSMDIFITCSNNYFNEYKNQLLKSLNTNINTKLTHYSLKDTNDQIIKNKSVKYAAANTTNSINYPIPDRNYKTSLISDITDQILIKYLTENGYTLTVNDSPLPVELKDNVPLICSGKYYSIQKPDKNTFNNNDIDKLNTTLSKIINEDLTRDLEKEKSHYKNSINYLINESQGNLGRETVFLLYSDKLFNINNDIDSITERDIKNYIQTYLLNQKPVVIIAKNEVISERPSSTGKSLLPAAYYLSVNFSAKRTENCSTPVETTQNYIPKTKIADHLNLPDIHVFEYPDTNLRVIINADENIMTADNPYKIMTTDNCTRLDEPLIEANIIQCDRKNFNLVKENVLHTIFKNRVNSDDIMSLPFAITVSTSLTNTVRNTNIADINKIIFNNDYSKEEFETAKKDTINNIKNNSSLSEIFFNPNELKTRDEIIKEIEHLSFDELKSYAENYMNNISMNIYAVVSKDYYEENKDKILSTLNKNITRQLKDLPQENQTTSLRINNSILPEETSTEQFIYALPFNNLKAEYVSNFAIMILNAYLENSGYTIECRYTNNPLSLKDNKPPHFETKYCQIKSLDKKTLNKSDFEKIKSLLENITSKDLSKDIDYLRSWQKDRCKTALTKPLMPMIKVSELECMSYGIFSCYEIIDSITEDDVKRIINNYLIKQTPIICNRNGRN